MSYITIILAGIPLTMIYNTESGLLRAIGNSITPLIFLIISSVINVILDVLFMGPLHLGIQGAASATILAQAISVVLCFFYCELPVFFRLNRESLYLCFKIILFFRLFSI